MHTYIYKHTRTHTEHACIHTNATHKHITYTTQNALGTNGKHMHSTHTIHTAYINITQYTAHITRTARKKHNTTHTQSGQRVQIDHTRSRTKDPKHDILNILLTNIVARSNGMQVTIPCAVYQFRLVVCE